MACTPAELFAALRAMGCAVPEGDGAREVCIALDAGEVTVAVAPRPPRLLGALVLPVLHVALRFARVTPATRATFVARFELHTRRGGG